MKYLKYSDEENKKALEKWGISVDDAAHAWQEDPSNDDKFMWFMRALGASKEPKKLSGTYVLKPDVMGKLMKIRRNIEELIEAEVETDGFRYEANYDIETATFIFQTYGFSIGDNKIDKALWEEIMSLCNYISFEVNKGGSISVRFTIKDAFIHIEDDEGKDK